MKKFILKIRLILTLWSTKQQACSDKLILSSIDNDLKSATVQFELVKDFVERPVILDRIRQLREERMTYAETVEFYRHRVQFLWRMLRA